MGYAEDLIAADPLPRILAWLNTHPAVVTATGGTGRISALNKPPYPAVRATTQGGSDGDLRWVVKPEIQFEAYGDLDGKHGREKVRRVLYAVLGALRELPDQPVPPGQPVITLVESVRGGGYLPEPTGQPRWVATVRVTAHPPRT